MYVATHISRFNSLKFGVIIEPENVFNAFPDVAISPCFRDVYIVYGDLTEALI